MCSVRTRPSARTMRNSPSIGFPSTRQSVTIAVSRGWSSEKRVEPSSSRGSGPASGERPKIWKSSSDQVTSSVSRFHSALPMRVCRSSVVVPGATGESGGLRGGRQPFPEPAEVLAEVVELVHGQVAERALPAALRVVLVHDGVAAHRVHVAPQPPGPGDQGVHRSRLGRLRGAVRVQMGRHGHSDAGAAMRTRHGQVLKQDRLRLWHSPRRAVRRLATSVQALLPAYAAGLPVSRRAYERIRSPAAGPAGREELVRPSARPARGRAGTAGKGRSARHSSSVRAKCSHQRGPSGEPVITPPGDPPEGDPSPVRAEPGGLGARSVATGVTPSPRFPPRPVIATLRVGNQPVAVRAAGRGQGGDTTR